MNCPHCGLNISDTAIRCRHCRKAFAPTAVPIRRRVATRYRDAKAWVSKILPQEDPAAWGPFSVGVFWALAFAGIQALEYYLPAQPLIELLRSRYFIFTREPRLQMYLYVFVDTLILKLWLTLMIVLFLSWKRLRITDALRLRNPTGDWTYFSLAFTTAALTVGLLQGTDPLMPYMPASLFFKESALIGNVLAVFSIVVVAPITEEIFFRGFMLPALKKAAGPLVSCVVVSVLFAWIHYAQVRDDPSALAAIFCAGTLLTVVRLVSGSTLYAIQLHACYNGAILSAGWIRHALELT